MSSFNQVTLVGRLTRDPEFKEFGRDGGGVVNFALAINEKKKGGEEKVSYFECKAFSSEYSKTADTIDQYARKGTLILVSGKLDNEQWEDKKSGEKRQRTVVIVNAFQFMESKKDRNDDDDGRSKDYGRDRGRTRSRDDDDDDDRGRRSSRSRDDDDDRGRTRSRDDKGSGRTRSRDDDDGDDRGRTRSRDDDDRKPAKRDDDDRKTKPLDDEEIPF